VDAVLFELFACPGEGNLCPLEEEVTGVVGFFSSLPNPKSLVAYAIC